MEEYDAHWTKRCEYVFSCNKPKEGQLGKYEKIRDTAKELGLIISMECPANFEKRKALSALRETIIWANASFACND